MTSNKTLYVALIGSGQIAETLEKLQPGDSLQIFGFRSRSLLGDFIEGFPGLKYESNDRQYSFRKSPLFSLWEEPNCMIRREK